MRTTGLFRIMCRRELPELRTVETRNGETSVLNLELVQYFNPEGTVSPWMKVTLWGAQAEKFAPLVEHNHAVYLDGDLQFEGYVTEAFDSEGNEKAVNRIKPIFKKINEFRLVNVVRPPSDFDGDVAENPIVQQAAAAAAGEGDYDEIPF